MTAPLVTVAAIGAGVMATGGTEQVHASLSAATHLPARSASSSLLDARAAQAVTRDFDRSAIAGASNVRPPKPTGTLWTTAPLDVRLTPTANAQTAGVVAEAKKVAVTGVRHGAFAEIVMAGVSRWVTADYLSTDRPAVTPAGLSDAPCPDGSGIEAGLQPDSIRVYRAVCAAFPELTTYGGQDGHGEHVNGQAIDFMISSHDEGERIKDFLYAHRVELHIFDIIWSQHIWTIERAGEGFRSMPDRGSATANHYDHVHMRII